MDDYSDFPVEIADKVVHMLHQVTGKNVNYMGQGGIILASMQPERLGKIHEGAKRIMAGEIDELAISVEDASKLKGSKPGYNGVILYQDKRLGCIGLSGDPKQMQPLQQLATIIVREEYEKFREEKRKQDMLNIVISEIQESSVAIQQISTGSENILQHSQKIEQMTNRAEQSIMNVNQVVKTVKQIADETMLLGYNASIEAARAGKYGGGFGVIAQEIGRLSAVSNDSLKNISAILDQMKSSVLEIAEKVRINTRTTQEQTDAIKNMKTNIFNIKAETDRLNEKNS
jgi:hypothetical protein